MNKPNIILEHIEILQEYFETQRKYFEELQNEPLDEWALNAHRVNIMELELKTLQLTKRLSESVIELSKVVLVSKDVKLDND